MVVFVTSPHFCGKYICTLRIQNGSRSVLIWGLQCLGGDPSLACGRIAVGLAWGRMGSKVFMWVCLTEIQEAPASVPSLGSVWVGPGGKR